jgi:hypothetical protein
MGYDSQVNTVRASSSAFMWGSLVMTDYKTGCLRKVLIQSHTPKSEIDEKYAIVGKLNEDRHQKVLESKGIDFDREVEFDRVTSVEGIRFTGHADFILKTRHGLWYSVDELKSVQSTNVRRNVIKNGEYLTENLAQTVRYMMEARVITGRLIYTFWQKEKKKKGEEESPDVWEAHEDRVFLVSIDDYGRIHVDGEPTKYTVQDLLAHENTAARCVKDSVIWPERPYRGEAPFVGCCNYCPHRFACNAFESGEVKDFESFLSYKQVSTEEVPNE